MDLKETAITLRSQANHLQAEAQKLLDAATTLDGGTNGSEPIVNTQGYINYFFLAGFLVGISTVPNDFCSTC